MQKLDSMFPRAPPAISGEKCGNQSLLVFSAIGFFLFSYLRLARLKYHQKF